MAPRSKTKVHARKDGVASPCGPALCGAESPYGLNFAGPWWPSVECKNCIAIIDEFNAKARAGVKV